MIYRTVITQHTHTHTHTWVIQSQCRQAFKAGVHVMLEKPMSINPESIGRVMRAAQQASGRSGTVFWIAEQAQYAPIIVAAQKLIVNGEIGGTLHLHTMSGAAGRPVDIGRASKTSATSRGQGTVIAAAGLPADDLRVPLEGEGSGIFGSARCVTMPTRKTCQSSSSRAR
eukprot:SAG31_NODE_983_length_10554_cov_6.049259_2_plen_170_part_00